MKCFKCKRPVEFDRLYVSKVIPESVSKIVLSSLVKDYGLGSDFSASSAENLIPVCPACYKSKSGSLLPPSSSLKSWFEQIRVKLASVDARVNRIDGSKENSERLRLVIEKLEAGKISPEEVERIVRPFLESVEGKPNSPIEIRLSDSVRLSFSESGLAMQAVTEIRYQKFVEGMVESGDWRRKSSEQIREGPRFGEGRTRRPKSGA